MRRETGQNLGGKKCSSDQGRVEKLAWTFASAGARGYSPPPPDGFGSQICDYSSSGSWCGMVGVGENQELAAWTGKHDEPRAAPVGSGSRGGTFSRSTETGPRIGFGSGGPDPEGLRPRLGVCVSYRKGRQRGASQRSEDGGHWGPSSRPWSLPCEARRFLE